MKNWCLLLIAVVLISCKKDIEELPEPTQTGANIFGANVAGKFWVPQKFGFSSAVPILEARYMPGRDIIINARNFASTPDESEFEIFLKNVVSPGVYLLNANTNKYPSQTANYAFYTTRRITPLDEWITNSQYTGKVEITKTDTINRIVSGVFEFNAVNINPSSQPITITEGRFDIKIP